MESTQNIYHQISISEEVKSKLNNETYSLLSLFGVPIRVASLPYEVFEEPMIKENHLILGRAHGSNSFNYLFLDLQDLTVRHQWNYLGDVRSVFINSGLREFYFTVAFLDEIIGQMTEMESLGKYGDHHQKYADLFKQILLKNDPTAYESAGMWYWYIDEMELGVI